MMNVGTFFEDTKTGKIDGVLYGVNMYPTKLIFEPQTSAKGSSYYKIYAQSQQATVEAGVAFPRVSRTEKARAYLEVKLNSPGLARTFEGKLFESEAVPGQHHLLWDEPDNKTEAKPAHITRPVAALAP